MQFVVGGFNRSQSLHKRRTEGPDCTSVPFQNPSLSFERRADDLGSRMTLEEKVSQMQNSAAAVPHLGIQAYNWKTSIQVKS